MACELPSDPPGLGPGASGKHCLRQLPMDKRMLVEVQVSEEKFQHVIGEKQNKTKQMSSDALERVRGTA